MAIYFQDTASIFHFPAEDVAYSQFKSWMFKVLKHWYQYIPLSDIDLQNFFDSVYKSCTI